MVVFITTNVFFFYQLLVQFQCKWNLNGYDYDIYEGLSLSSVSYC